jgi:DNA-binding winged helix-turn-helix (wHTH) protein
VRLRNLPVRFIVFGGVSTVLIVTIVLVFALRTQREVVMDVQTQAVLTVEAFAQAAEAWISRGDLETISRVADLMLSGSSLYVQVVHGNTALVERVDTSWRGLPPPLQTSVPPSGSSGRFRRDHSVWYVDALVPLPSAGIAPSSGYVRAGIDVGFVKAQVVAATLRTAGLGAIGWAVCLAAFLALMRRPSSALPGEQTDDSSVILRHGGWTIDTASVEVTVDGKRVRLTPKQFELAGLLTAARGRVVSDQEIIARLWPESPYADSNDVRQCVYRLRRRMNAAHPGTETRIDNVKGFGYRLLATEPEETQEELKPRPLRPRGIRRRCEGGRNE